MRLVLAAIVISCFLGSCFYTRTKITLVSNSVPLTFKIEGDSLAEWIWVRGPYQNECDPAPELPNPADPEDFIVWRIAPAAENDVRWFVPMSKIPDITYGQVPEGWEQVRPESRTPRALLDGYVYHVGVVARGGADLHVLVKNGEIHPYEEPGPGRPCEKKD
jgi:hypothetical protein